MCFYSLKEQPRNMKKIFLILGLLISSFVSFGQAFTTPRSSSTITVQDSRLRGLLNFYLPHTHGLTLNGGLDTLGMILFEDSSGHIWYRDTIIPAGGHQWRMVLRTGDGVSGVSSFNTRTGAVTLSSGDILTALGYTPVNPNGTSFQYIAGDGSKVTFPTIPAQINITDAGLFTHSGTYPNYTFNVSTPNQQQVFSSGSTLNQNNFWVTGTNVLGIIGTSAFGLPTGSTSQRPSSPGVGYFRYNTDSSATETWNGSQWVKTGTGTGITGVTSFNTRTGTVTLTSGDVNAALGFTPYNASNPAGYISNITGKITNGANISITGSGTSGDPYVIIGTATGGSGCLNCNADSLKKYPIDTSLRRNGYALTFDSLNHKWVLAPNGSGTGITALTGDGTAAGSGSVAFTLATVNSNVGTFGSASSVSQVTLNGKGLATAASSVPIQIAESQVTNLTTDLAAKLGTSLTSGNIFVGNGSNVATGVAMSGDGTISNTGVLTITKRDSLFGVLDNVAGQNRTVDFGSTYLFTLNHLFNGTLLADTSSSSIGAVSMSVSRVDNSAHMFTQYRTGQQAGVRTSWNSGNPFGQLYGSTGVTTGNEYHDNYWRAYQDSLVERLYNGNAYYIRGLNTTSDSTNFKPLAINPTTGEKRQMTFWPGSGGGGSGITQLTGDVTAGPGSGSQIATLATVNSNIGTFGSASSVGQFTVNGKGLITAASSVAIQIAESQVTNLVTDLAGKQAALSGTGYLKFAGTTPSYLTPTQVTADLNLFTSSLQGLTPASGGGTSTFLRADGTWVAPPGSAPGGITGNIQFNKLGSFAAIPGANSDTTFGYTSFNLVQGIKEVVAGDSVMPGIVGQVFADPFTGGSLNTTNWTSHLTSATLAFPGTYMDVTVSSFSALNGNYIEMNTPEGWIQDTAYFSWTPVDTTTTSYGPGFGPVSHNSFYNRGYMFQFPASSGGFGNKGEIVTYTQDSVGGYTQRNVSSATAMTIGDTLDVKVARNDSSITAIQRNRRTGVTLTYTYFYAANNTVANNQLANTGNFRIYFIGGHFHLFNFSVYSPDRKGGVVYVGNSILMGYYTPFWNYRWVSLLHPNNRYIYDLLGGPGDRSIEYLKDTFNLWLHTPKLVYWCGTENDLNGSLGPATTATNLQSFITSCKNHNTPVVVIGGAPQTGKLIKPYNDSAQAVAARNNVTYANVYDTLRSGTDYNPAFSTDGVHPNQPGHAAYATQVSKQDPNFSYSILRADNMGTYLDANSRYVIFSPTSPYGLTAGRRIIDSPIYFHQTPITADTGTLFTTGALHIGAKPESQLNNAVSWIVGNGQSTSQIFAVQGLNAGDYPGMEIVDNLGNRTGFYYQANGGAAFNPGYMVTESNVAGKGIRFIGGLGTARGSDYDMEVDSLSVKMQHNLLLPNIPNKTSLLGTDSVLVKDNTGKVFSAATSLIGGGGTPGGANTQIQFNNSGAFGGSANLTWNGTTLTTNALAISTYAAAGANDSVLTWDAASKSVRMRSGIFNLYPGNGVNFTGGDTVNWGGTLALNTIINGAGFSIAFGTSGSNLGGFSITGGKYNSSQGAQILGAASTINNAITAASGSVTNFSAYAFLAPTVTSTNTGVTYSHPSTLYIDAAPTMSTNSTASNASYALNVNTGISHFGLGASNISGIFDGSISVGVTGSVSNAYLLEIGPSTSSQSSIRIDIGADVTSPASGALWFNGTNLYFSDGANKRDLFNGIHNYVHSIFTPATGGTVNLVANNYNIINPSGALATLTVNLPSSPVNNDVVYIKYTQAVTAVTYGNGTVVDGITAPTAGGLVTLVYDSGTTSWY